jgi:hypothetical protein
MTSNFTTLLVMPLEIQMKILANLDFRFEKGMGM